MSESFAIEANPSEFLLRKTPSESLSFFVCANLPAPRTERVETQSKGSTADVARVVEAGVH